MQILADADLLALTGAHDLVLQNPRPGNGLDARAAFIMQPPHRRAAYGDKSEIEPPVDARPDVGAEGRVRIAVPVGKVPLDSAKQRDANSRASARIP